MGRFRLPRGLLSALLGGGAALIGMIVPALWPLALLGVLGYAVSGFQSSSWKHALSNGLLFGLLASMGGVWWFWDTLPLSWLSVPEGPVQYVLVGIVYGLTVLSLALPFALVAPLVRRIPNVWYRSFVFALLFILIEELRMWSFALFFLGTESMLAPHFSVAGLGYALTESALFLPVAQGGHYALNGMLAFCAAAFLDRRRARVLVSVTVIVLSLVVAHALLPNEQGERTLRVGLISSYAPPGPFTELPAVLQPMRGALDQSLDVIVTPEGLGLSPFFDATTRQSLYGEFFAGRNGLVISSSQTQHEDRSERAALIYETVGEGVIASQDKIFFVPVGEYLPPLIRAGISLAGKDNLGEYGSYIAGKAIPGTTLAPATHDSVRFGALLCSELLSPYLYSALGKDTDVLINLANNSWFHGSHLLYERLQQVAKTHALKNRQWFLVASNGSPAYAIDARGQLQRESEWGVSGLLVVEVPL